MFDSIQADLNTRLLISSKSSQGEAEAGTNDTKYMTPLKVQQKLNSLIKTVSFDGTETLADYTIVDLTGYAGKVVNIVGCVWADSSTASSTYTKGIIKVNGTILFGNDYWNTEVGGVNKTYRPFSMTIDMNTKTITGVHYIGGNSDTTEPFTMYFSSITSVVCRLQSVNDTNRRTHCVATVTISN